MKKLQNNFTTPEQSKRLLELGVPADSADCYYSHYIKTYTHSEYTEILWHRPRFITDDNNPNWNARLMDGTQTYLPCWSVGRLIDIYNMCVDFDLDDGAAIVIFIQDESPIVQMMQMFEDKVGIMDFSNLEDKQ